MPDPHMLRGDSALTLLQVDALFASVPVGFVWIDRDLRFLRINDWLAKTHGCSVTAHLGRSVSEIVPAMEPFLREVTARIAETGEPVLDEVFAGETAQDSGQSRVWSHHWYPVRNELSEIVGFSAMVTDITERSMTDAALQLKNDRFEVAVKASKAVLWQQDLDMRFTWLHNPAPGIDGSNAVGKLDSDLLERAEDAEFIDHLKREVVRSGVGVHTEFYPQIQGVVHCFEVLMEPLRDAAGKITGLTGAAIDVTERKREEAERHESDQFYRALAEASLEIPYRMSADWSEMVLLDGPQIVASSNEALSGWAWLMQNVPADEHDRIRQAIQDAIHSKSLFEMEHRVVRPDGSTGWVRSRAVPLLDQNNVVTAWFGAASDITERKEAEHSLMEATIAAQKANKAKSDFLSNMSHELRTPLNSILGFAQLMECGTPEPSPVQKKYLEHIVKGGWYLLHLIDELLDLAQIDTGKLTLEMEPFSLAEVMIECQAMLEPQANERSIKMSFHLANLTRNVIGDRMRVKQVALNVLSNAIKYNRPGGAVDVEIVMTTPGTVRVCVTDTGEGLAPEQLAQLFQSFNRLGREAGPVQGTGIGLVMSKRLIEQMEGRIGADSTIGVGSEFWFELRLSA